MVGVQALGFADPSVIVHNAFFTAVRDAVPGRCDDRVPIPDNLEGDTIARLPVEWHSEEINSRRRCLDRRWWVAPDLYRHVRGGGDDRVDKDLVLGDDCGIQGWLIVWIVACGTSRGTGFGWIDSVPEDEFVLRNIGQAGVAALVRVDVVRENGAPRVVWHVVDVALGTRGDTPRSDGANVVRFTVVIPGDDLNELRLHLENLLPSIVPEGVAPPDPILFPLWEAGVEPWRYTHHIRLGPERGLPSFVLDIGHVVCTFWPCVPAD
jgi:hypothetical protein